MRQSRKRGRHHQERCVRLCLDLGVLYLRGVLAATSRDPSEEYNRGTDNF